MGEVLEVGDDRLHVIAQGLLVLPRRPREASQKDATDDTDVGAAGVVEEELHVAFDRDRGLGLELASPASICFGGFSLCSGGSLESLLAVLSSSFSILPVRTAAFGAFVGGPEGGPHVVVYLV